MIYLDNAATTAVSKEVLDEMMPYFTEMYGNPSSIHAAGVIATDALLIARQRVARAIGAFPQEIYFTSGGTESDNLAIKGVAEACKRSMFGKRIITTRIEHKAVLNTCASLRNSGWQIDYVDVDKYGVVDLDQLERLITQGNRPPILVSIMAANNEFGTTQNLKAISHMCHSNGALFQTDAVQAIGAIPIDVRNGIDLLSISAHKFHGPKGVGALYVARDLRIGHIIDGGGQEHGLRSGTQNVPGIVGLGRAIDLAFAKQPDYAVIVTRLRNMMIDEIMSKIPNVTLNGHPDQRLPNNINITIHGVNAMALVRRMSSHDIMISTGSACSSHSTSSDALSAIGLSDEDISSTIRITLDYSTTQTDIHNAVAVLRSEVEELRHLF